MARKRPAEAAQEGSSSADASHDTKKRKTDKMEEAKFYAVRAGHVPGVYKTWAECTEQTWGFKGANYKKFSSLSDAKAWAAGKNVAPSKDAPSKYYAVAVGEPTGIYTDWAEASEAIKGTKGPKYKKFFTKEEAVGYIIAHGNKAAIDALGADVNLALKSESETNGNTEEETSAQVKRDDALTHNGDVIPIYTDGASSSNGKVGARAGVGVWFGHGDERNLSERLQGPLQTNQRAELTAIQRALELAPRDASVQIFSDSNYSIKCVTEWSVGWKARGWQTSKGEEVKNRDLVENILALMADKREMGALVMFKWVKGHANDPGNIAADRLATQGAKMA